MGRSGPVAAIMDIKITQEFLLEILEYDESSGKLWWKPRGVHLFSDGKWSAESKRSAWNKRLAGKEAFTCVDRDGYRVGILFGKNLFVHRLIWLLKTGAWPCGEVDHKDGVSDNNKWDNLRDVSPIINSRNTADLIGRNTSGKTGVMWKRSANRWRVRIGRVELGLYKCFEEAVRVREAAEVRYGYTPRHGVS